MVPKGNSKGSLYRIFSTWGHKCLMQWQEASERSNLYVQHHGHQGTVTALFMFWGRERLRNKSDPGSSVKQREHEHGLEETTLLNLNKPERMEEWINMSGSEGDMYIDFNSWNLLWLIQVSLHKNNNKFPSSISWIFLKYVQNDWRNT